MARKSGKSRKGPKSDKGRAPRGWFRRLLPYVALVFCAGLAGLALYMVHLDHEVRSKFEGTRWKLPAKVYASPLQLYAGLDVSEQGLEKRLKRDGYSQTSELGGQGTYTVSGSTISIHIRRFQFSDGVRPAREVKLGFNSTGVSSINAIDGKGKLSLIRLDPLLIGSIYPTKKGSDRILVKLSNVPSLLPAGLIAVEDRSFMTNWGVSPKAILRAAVADVSAGHIVQGGSTLTQQLVRNFYLSDRQTIRRKMKEVLMALLLNANFSKKEILQAYINEVYLGQDGNRSIHGFALASYFYFNKPLRELKPRQMALLIGMVKGPSYYNPRTHPKHALRRRNVVLDLFHKAGLINTQAWKKAKASRLGVSSESGHGQTQYPAFIDLVRQQLHGQYKESDLTEAGLRIFTTLDPSVQAAAQKEVNQGVKRDERKDGLKKGQLESAAVVTSVEGGDVLAVVGGTGQGNGFNRALDAHRQVGSVMKPVDYLSALEHPSQFNAITPLSDEPLTVKLSDGQTWSPRNYSGKSHGKAVPLYYALEHSFNIASSRLALSVGIPNIVKTLHQMGFPGKPKPLPSLALGAVGMTPLDVAQVYNTIATGGYYTPLRAIRDVSTRNGKPLTRYPLTVHRVAKPGPAYITQWLMERVARDGTGAGMYRVLPQSVQMAGKTGTTNNWRDAWFAGFGNNRVTAVWVGRNDDKSTHLTGATGALPIWSRIMRDIHAQGIINTPPDSVTQIPLQLVFDPSAPNNGLGPNPNALYTGNTCPGAVPVPFIKGYVPQGLKRCDTDIMSQNAQQGGQPPAHKHGNWFQRLF